MHHVHAWPLKTPENVVECPGTQVTDNCEPLCKCWETNPGLLQEQVFCTAESSLQLPI